MTDLKPALLSALSGLNARCVTGFPQQEYALPLIVVSDEGGGVIAQADGAPCLEEYLFSVSVYAANPVQTESLAEQTDQSLSALGLRCQHWQDLYDEDARAYRKYLRYRAVLKNGLIYQ